MCGLPAVVGYMPRKLRCVEGSPIGQRRESTDTETDRHIAKSALGKLKRAAKWAVWDCRHFAFLVEPNFHAGQHGPIP